MVTDGAGVVRSAGHAVERVLGWLPRDLVGQPFLGHVHEAERGYVQGAITAALDGSTATVSHRLRTAGGGWLAVTTTSCALDDGNGGALVLLTTGPGEHSARTVTDRYREIVRTSMDALVVHVEGRIVAVSPPALRLLGADDESQIIGRMLPEFAAPNSAGIVERRRRLVQAGGWPGAERATICRLDGTLVQVETASAPVLWHDAMASQITLRPIRDTSDELASLAPAVARSIGAAAVVADLSWRVVAVNDAACELYGWDPDAVIGRQLADACGWDPGADTGREAAGAVHADGAWEGPMVHHDRARNALRTECTMRSLQDASGERIGVLSVVRVVAEAEGPDDADHAISRDLRAAMAAGEVTVFYQPIVALEDGEVLKVEALVRWEHPERGMISPADFVEAAERTGAIVELGAYVLDRACAQVAAWRRTRHPGLELSVNLSPRELADIAVADRVQQALVRHGLPAHALWLEVTETAMSSDPKGALAVLRRLRDLGVRLAIDDFGTGFANLANLRQYPFGAVKIDRSFVSGLGVDASDLVIVRSILKLAGELGLLVVAEGVETEEQRDMLLEHGCELGQGYLFSRPTAADDADAWLLPATGDEDAGSAAAEDDAPVLDVLRDIDITRDAADPALELTARAAAALLDVPAALVAVADGEDGVRVLTGVGVEVDRSGPSALYRRAVADASGTCVLAGSDVGGQFGDDPIVGVADARTWVATTLVVDGTVVGVLCVADRRLRDVGPAELVTIRQLGLQAAATLELRHQTLELYRCRRALTVTTQQLQELSAIRRALEHVSQDMFAVVNVDGTVRSVTPAGKQLVGEDVEAWVGRNALDLVHPDDLPTAVVSLAETAATVGQARPIELRLQVEGGGYETFEITSTTFETASGGHRVLICARDRPGSTALTNELAWTRAVFGAGLGLVEDIVVLCDERGTVRPLSAAARALHTGAERLPLADWADRLALRTIDGAPVPLTELPLFKAAHGEPVTGAYALERPGGLEKVEARAVPVALPDGTDAGAVMALRRP